MTSMPRITGAAIAWTLVTTGCPAADDDGTTSPTSSETDATTTDSATQTQTQTDSESDSMTSADPTTSESDSDTAPTMCNGGAACGEGEYCSNGSQSCDCDGDFDYCELSSTPPGCYPVPQPCAVLMDPDRETCIADFDCNIGGEFVDGTLQCQTYEECAGDCDFDPASCEDDTSSTTAADSGSSESGSSGDESSTTG